ncbi:DUF1236 domain-containing protein [Roseiarcus sp.]|uniref:DUF1236 domain-containing protein n=1 Tax=Roseiarcus sp. TaxID=1969460 RepID=UPI003F97F3E8
MRRSVLSLVVLLVVASVGHAQQKSTLQGAFGSPESATGGLRGVYGPPESAPGQLRGVYAPPQSVAPASLPTTIIGPSSATSDSVPNVTMPGEAAVGQALPQGVDAAPMPDRPGYGRAIVNGRNAIVDTNSHQIVQFSD